MSKYVRKVWKNGGWRYYYDNDKTPDKGFAIKNMKSSKTHHDLYAGKKKFLSYDTYKVGDKLVRKDVYEHSKAHLFYKNEPVKDIAKRGVKNATTKAKSAVDDAKKKKRKQKGNNYVNDILNRVKNGK